MPNPVVTRHGVEIYLTDSEWSGCKELVIIAADRGGPRKVLPGLVLDETDLTSLHLLFMPTPPIGYDPLPSATVEVMRAETFSVWSSRVVRSACEQNGIPISALKDKRRSKTTPVRRARAQAVRVLVGFMSYGEAGKKVGIEDHSSVFYWVKGAGKDKYK